MSSRNLSKATLAHDRALNIINSIRSHLDDNRRGEILRSGIKLAIFGPPNAGKSSLFNFLGMYPMLSETLIRTLRCSPARCGYHVTHPRNNAGRSYAHFGYRRFPRRSERHCWPARNGGCCRASRSGPCRRRVRASLDTSYLSAFSKVSLVSKRLISPFVFYPFLMYCALQAVPGLGSQMRLMAI